MASPSCETSVHPAAEGAPSDSDTPVVVAQEKDALGAAFNRPFHVVIPNN
eukprot:m.130353 g.130353  ORF g.130353 m.130353 type:complete len:50 (-) comp13710_c1_seq1:89-238(-)